MSEEGTTPSSGSAVGTVVERLKGLIGASGYQQGDRLPPERQLAADMGVSRNTIREALGSLASMGVIEIKRGSGAFVRDLASGSLLDSMAFLIEISPVATLLDLLTLRRIVEAEAASLACVRITEEQLAELSDCLERMSDVAAEPAADLAELDVRFHQLINDAAGNPALSALGAALNNMTFRLRLLGGGYTAASPASAHDDHAAIFDAIRDRDPARASAAAAAHVGVVERSLRAAEKPGP